jgi:hypothetical protein
MKVLNQIIILVKRIYLSLFKYILVFLTNKNPSYIMYCIHSKCTHPGERICEPSDTNHKDPS